MTTRNESALALLFQQGDVPSGTDYANLIDSQVNVAETSAQTMQGPLITSELIAPQVSATNGTFTGTMRIGGTTSAADIYADALRVSALSISTISAKVAYASAGRFVNGVYIGGEVIISAVGTAQTTASILTASTWPLR